MAINYTTLLTEIQTDPLALGYANAVQNHNDTDIALLLNTVGVGANYVVPQEPLLPQQVFSAINSTEYAALTSLQLTQLLTVLTLPLIDPQNASIRTIMSSIFPAGSATRTALAALVNRQGTRAEKLFGNGTLITQSDISFALRGAR